MVGVDCGRVNRFIRHPSHSCVGEGEWVREERGEEGTGVRGGGTGEEDEGGR